LLNIDKWSDSYTIISTTVTTSLPRLNTLLAMGVSTLFTWFFLTGVAQAEYLQPFYDLPIAQHPESVAFDPVQRSFYAGSVLAKGIVKVDGVSGATRV